MEQIQMMNTLDFIARVPAKDCIVAGNKVVFLVPEEAIKKAIGKKGAKVKELQEKIRKKVEIFEYTNEPKNFLQKAFSKAKIQSIEIKEINGKKIVFVKPDKEGKEIILRNLGRLKSVKELAKRNYGIEEIRVR